MPTTTAPRFSGALPAQVAGFFYPDDAGTLSRLLDEVMTDARSRISPGVPPKAIIAPHAGYSYSASVAAGAYAHLEAGRSVIRKVVLLGPAHRYGFRGIACSSAAALATPLGVCRVATDNLADVLESSAVRVENRAFQNEHCLEVHLPFLQTILGEFELVPLVVGQCRGGEVASLLAQLWGGPETCIVVSSDLSHFHPDLEARRIDAATAGLIESGRFEELTPRHACGALAIQGLLANTARFGLRMKAIDLRNSNQTVGNPDRVVGYGAFISEEIGAKRVEPPVSRTQAEPAVAKALGPTLFTTGVAAPWTAVREPEEQSPKQPELGMALTQGEQALLIRAAVEAITRELRTGQIPEIRNPSTFTAALMQPAGTFVTLRKEGELRGCIGTLQANEPLAANVIRNACNAAFRDRRFPPLRLDELPGLEIHLSILSIPESIAFDGEWDLIRRLRPGVDGLILHAEGKSAVFLPSVWEQIAAPREFVLRLKQKAGLNPAIEYASLTAERFTTFSITATVREDKPA